MTITCEELRAVSTDVALDDLTGSERAVALDHLAACRACRAVVADLAAAADAVLLLAPSIEPPSGFESRVLVRMDAVPARRRWTRIALIAAAAAGWAIVVGSVVVADDGARTFPAAAELRTASGEPAGNVLLADDPDRMTCVFEHERFGGDYAVEVVLVDGSTVDVGDFRADGVPWSWTVPLPVDAADVRVVRVLDDEGVVRVTAELDA